MTRRDFVRLAEALRQCRPQFAEDCPVWQQWAQDVRGIASALGENNPRFDRARFIAYCEQGGAHRIGQFLRELLGRPKGRPFSFVSLLHSCAIRVYLPTSTTQTNWRIAMEQSLYDKLISLGQTEETIKANLFATACTLETCRQANLPPQIAVATVTRVVSEKTGLSLEQAYKFVMAIVHTFLTDAGFAAAIRDIVSSGNVVPDNIKHRMGELVDLANTPAQGNA